MSLQLPLEQLEHLRRDARLLVEHTGTHQHRLDTLVSLVEQDLRHAEADATAVDLTNAGVDQFRHLLGDHVQRSAAGAATARQLCVSAREQHAAACQLLADLNGDDGAGRRCPNAVLVVDDYGDVRELVARILQNAGFVVRTAANGLEGLIAAYEMRPAVIVMDVSMPVLDGIEATRLIKASDATRDARVIAYTGDPWLDNARVKGLFAAVLHKPAAAADVLAAVQQVAQLST